MSISLQRASMWKRISAWLFDTIITAILAVGFMFAVMGITKYDSYDARLQEKRIEYAERFGIDFNISNEDYEKLSDEEKAVYEAADEAISNDEEAQKLSNKLLSLRLLSLCLGILLGIFVWHFLIPSFLKNGQTVGKKCFGLAVVRTNCVKISSMVFFIRSMIGIYAIETMVPVFLLLMLFAGAGSIVLLIVIVGILLLQIIAMCVTKTNSCIHDLVSDTMVVDFGSQQIFESEEALLAYMEAEHAKMVAQANGEREYEPISLFPKTYSAQTNESDETKDNDSEQAPPFGA